MNELEIAAFNARVEQKWGGDFAANKALVQRAFDRAGPHAQGLKESVLASGPDIATFVYQSFLNAERNR